MILFDERTIINYSIYGIEIPVSESKFVRTFKALMNDLQLSGCVNEWFMDKISEKIEREDLERVHSKEYIGRLFSAGLEKEIVETLELVDDKGKYNRYDPAKAQKPLTELFKHYLLSVAGTYQACRITLEKKFCFFFGGGSHHAQRDRGAGFCLLNDVVIASRKLQKKDGVKKIWVIDLDAHKGDGTAALTENDDSIITLSIHMAKGWPLDQPQIMKDGGRNLSFVPSKIDIPVEAGEEKEYNMKLYSGLQELKKKFARPDLVFVVSGVDPYEKDELPSAALLKLSQEQMLERDILVHGFVSDEKIPAAYVASGGYGKSSWEIYAQFLIPVLKSRYCDWKK